MCRTNEPFEQDGAEPACRSGGACDRCSARIVRATELLRVEDGVMTASGKPTSRTHEAHP
jgi:hypothetical protein